ncbi:MAG: restriction endonuclease [Syntrophomonadaceae bacterium]|nr:restriction endonuclease [Syntrophomonadaceae bacterium]
MQPSPLDVFKYTFILLTHPAVLSVLAVAFVFYWLLPELVRSFGRWIDESARRRAEAAARAKEQEFIARARKTGVEAVDKMNGREFEEWLKVKFEQMGYKVRLKSGSKDQGADLVLFKGGIKTVVQAKKRTSQNVGVKVLGELTRAMKYHNAQRGIVVTNRYFTREMLEEASEYDDIELWDRERLVQEIEKASQRKTLMVRQSLDGYRI